MQFEGSILSNFYRIWLMQISVIESFKEKQENPRGIFDNFSNVHLKVKVINQLYQESSILDSW